MKRTIIKAVACSCLVFGLSSSLYALEGTHNSVEVGKDGNTTFISNGIDVTILSKNPAALSDQVETRVPAGTNGTTNFQSDGLKPRTLHDYIDQEKDFYDFLLKNHPIFKIYQKEGRILGTPKISTRTSEWEDFNGGDVLKKELHHPVSVAYRLGMESILDFPNKFVGPEKCGECHPTQYAAWERSRHNKIVRFPEEMEENGGNPKLPMYGTENTALPEGIGKEDVLFVFGTPRTKHGFMDNWLVRGSFHVEGGEYGKGTGTLVAGGNQFSRNWTQYITPEVARKIKEFVPDFPTKLEDFGETGSYRWGTNSYGAAYKKSFLFQPASSYCEVCHTFKFNFKSKQEFYAALGNHKEMEKHVVSKGISCEECHGAGAHLYGARGAGMPSNCERCHQRFRWDAKDSKLNPRKPFNVFFKSACPACGTENSQMFSTAHYDKGMRCTTCHDPHEVTKNDWRDPYTLTGLKKECGDCHKTQKSFFKKGGIHAKDNCTGCHMPNMMSCENFAAIQYPDKAGFDNVRASHIWKIKVDKAAKTLNPPEGQPRHPGNKTVGGGWTFARDTNGRFFLDLMWSCGRTAFEDPNLVKPGASGCHSAVQSTLPKDLHFTDQATIYEKVVAWQNPVKEGFAKIEKGLAAIDVAMTDNSKLSTADKSKVILLAKQAEDIKDKVEKDGSWGVHGPKYTLKIINEGLVYIDECNEILGIKANK